MNGAGIRLCRNPACMETVESLHTDGLCPRCSAAATLGQISTSSEANR